MASTRQSRVGGIILAGSYLWGESPLEWIGPRPLLPVAGRPLVWYGLDWLRRSGIEHVTVCANSHTSALRSCLGNDGATGVFVDYYEDVMPRGPAGCVHDAARGRSEDVLVVMEGALLPRADLREILRAHVESRSVLTIVAVEQGSLPSGVAQLKPAGIYVVSRSALDLVPERGYQDIKEMWVPRLHEHGRRVTPFVIDAEAAIGVTGLGSYLRAAVSTLENVSERESRGDDYRRVGRAWVHRSARVSESARLSDLVLVGPRAWIEPKVVILGRTIVGPESRIGTAAILNDVVSWPGCEVGKGAILNRCILLSGSSIEPGLVVRDTVCCGSTDGRPQAAVGTASAYWAMEPQPSTGHAGTRSVSESKPVSTSERLSDVTLSPSPV